MSTAMVVSGSETGKLVGLLSSAGISKTFFVATISDAKRRIRDLDLDFVIINCPIGDEMGVDLAITAAEETDAAVLMMVRYDAADNVNQRVESYGVWVVAKPINPNELAHLLRMICNTRQRYLRLKQQNAELLNKLEEIRMVSRAKLLLMQADGITEAEAHRRIEKLAMDTRSTRLSIAKTIINNYDN